MGKFTIQWNSTLGQSIPEDSGWTWVTEKISPPSPRYKFVSLGGASGSVDMSKSASGSLLYDDRTITVTFARFKHGQSGWLDDIITLTNAIDGGFSSGLGVYVFPKTQSHIKYLAKGYTWDYGRDGIIQYVYLTFKIVPTGTVVT